MVKFYLIKNAAKPVVVGGKTFRFEAVEYFEPTSSWWGTFASEDAADIYLLDQAVAARRISEISEADFAEYEVKKKQTPSSGNIVNLRNWHSPKNTVSTGLPAQVVEGTARPNAAESLIDALESAVPSKAPPVRAKRARTSK